MGILAAHIVTSELTLASPSLTAYDGARMRARVTPVLGVDLRQPPAPTALELGLQVAEGVTMAGIDYLVTGRAGAGGAVGAEAAASSNAAASKAR